MISRGALLGHLLAEAAVRPAMTSAITNPVELRSRGFQALVKELGWVNAVRFLREYETGGGD